MTAPIRVGSLVTPLPIFGFPGRIWLWQCRLPYCPRQSIAKRAHWDHPAALAAGLAHLDTHTETR